MASHSVSTASLIASLGCVERWAAARLHLVTSETWEMQDPLVLAIREHTDTHIRREKSLFGRNQELVDPNPGSISCVLKGLEPSQPDPGQ